jgi:hypothetical protein
MVPIAGSLVFWFQVSWAADLDQPAGIAKASRWRAGRQIDGGDGVLRGRQR